MLKDPEPPPTWQCQIAGALWAAGDLWVLLFTGIKGHGERKGQGRGWVQ